MHELLQLVTVGLIRPLHCCSDFSRVASTAKRGIYRAATPTYKPGPVWVFSLKGRTLWNSTKDQFGSGGSFAYCLRGREPDFRVEDDGPTGIPNNGAFYFALPTKSVLDSPL